MAMKVRSLVDAFVERINGEAREAQPLAEVPESLRETSVERREIPDNWTAWRIVRADNRDRIALLQTRIGRRFPPSFLDLVERYSFPAFERGSLLFFGNHPEETSWDLSRRLFLDPTMSPMLLRGGFIQIGNPFFYNYDPICFDCNLGRKEARLVQLDHEAILCADTRVLREIAPSFIDFLKASIE